MKTTTKLVCASAVSALALLAACGPTDGYYDSRGNYHYSGARDARDDRGNAYYADRDYSYGDPDRDDNFYVDHSATRGDKSKVAGYDRRLDPEMRPYRRAGYYDYQGAYVPYADGPVIARSYMPPKGKCRVWFQDRPAVEQPPIESCVGIQYRVPAGAYVIFGG